MALLFCSAQIHQGLLAAKTMDSVGAMPVAGRKVVVFGHHSSVLDGLEEAVQGMKYTSESGPEQRAGHMRIDGSTSARLRSDHVKTFQGSEHCRVALLSIKAAGVRLRTAAEKGLRLYCCLQAGA